MCEEPEKDNTEEEDAVGASIESRSRIEIEIKPDLQKLRKRLLKREAI